MKIVLTDTLTKKGKSQYWLHKATGIAASTISNLCNGRTTRIEFSVLQKICDALDCDISDIIMTDSAYENRMLHYTTAINEFIDNKDDNE